MRSLVILFALSFVLCVVAVSDPHEALYAKQLKEGEFAANEDTVVTQYGTIKGAVYKGNRAFYAIPYAQPPLGSLRFQPAQPPLPWNETLHAKVYGPGCPQVCDLPPFTCTYAGTSENCLTLDVYTPRLANLTTPAPVLMFIHGGNFIQGGTGTILYNADYIANNTRVVVVNVQYRLGALGFFYNANVSLGNFGIRDQTLALQWIQGNIAAFGGDPSRVTIWGQSAGGASVAAHMISPTSYPYFNGGCMDSNPITLNFNTLDLADQLSTRFANILGCTPDDLACLQAQTVDNILSAQNAAIEIYPLHPLNAFMPWLPMVDGSFIPYQPLQAFASGNYNKDVPFVTGTVNNEGLMFIDQAFPNPVPFSEFVAIIGVIFGPVAPQVLKEYPVPPSQYNDTRSVMSTLGTDYIFLCPVRNAIRQMSNYSTNVYYYHFNHAFTNFDPWGPNYPECVGYVCHGSELPYIFNSAEIGHLYTHYVWSSSEAVLANQISTFWGNFATSGTPNGPFSVSLPWPVYQQSLDQDLEFATPSVVETNYRESYCDFWDTLGYTWGN